MVVWKLPTYVSDTINSLPSCIHDNTFTNSLNGLSIYCKRSEEPPPHLLGAPLVLNPKWRGGSETSLCLNSLIWIAFRKSPCRVCIKNVMNVPTRTFCFVAATQTPKGKKLLFLTRILAITISMWILLRESME